MSLPEDFEWRGCASAYAEPVREEDEQTAVCLVNQVQHCNPRFTIEFRHGWGDYDRLHHVFRWTREPVDQVFRHGFRRSNDRNTEESLYFDLDYYVNHGGTPLDPNRPHSFAYISTTADSGWQPDSRRCADGDVLFRYEIYAPGGIFISSTLGEAYQFPRQAEVVFVFGIAPQYIRSAQRFRTGPQVSGSRHPARFERVDRELLINRNFRPSRDRQLPILNPVSFYRERVGDTWRAVALTQVVYPSGRERRQVSTVNDLDWYSTLAADMERWISAAFSSSRRDEVYIFMGNKYVLVNYAPGTTNDHVINGPYSIYEGFPSLACTFFAEWGIDCAFRSHHGNEAFIFCGNLCALIDFAPHTDNDKILKGPMTIAQMFPFFRGTEFEKGIDAAFESSKTDECYLFKGSQYARINYNAGSAKLFGIRNIAGGFPSLRGTIFESGIDAAFASHIIDQAYLFKGDTYVRINFAPGTTDDCILGKVQKILPYWPSLQGILPCKNQGFDEHEHEHPLSVQIIHDEL